MKSYYVLIMSLYYAVINNEIETVKSLIYNNVNINNLMHAGDNALYYASDRGHLEMVKFLVENGININYVNKTFNDNALYAAVRSGNLEIVKYLVNKGINFNLRNIYGLTALDIAIRLNHHHIVDFLQNYNSKKRELENKEFSENKKIRVN